MLVEARQHQVNQQRVLLAAQLGGAGECLVAHIVRDAPQREEQRGQFAVARVQMYGELAAPELDQSLRLNARIPVGNLRVSVRHREPQRGGIDIEQPAAHRHRVLDAAGHHHEGVHFGVGSARTEPQVQLNVHSGEVLRDEAHDQKRRCGGLFAIAIAAAQLYPVYDPLPRQVAEEQRRGRDRRTGLIQLDQLLERAQEASGEISGAQLERRLVGGDEQGGSTRRAGLNGDRATSRTHTFEL
mmetsp:Transcript_8068/g.24997  ORF Transcript_8068/g.24997 Transcript_8068/m.24997 type:complete len:242 (+) Transcript_8068:1261-1986(+)